MTYFFSGVFILGDTAEVARRVCDEFGGRAGTLDVPMQASVVAFGADYDCFDPPEVFDEALVRFSCAFPGQTFVRLQTHCWGGAIDFEAGTVFADGRVIGTESSEEKSIIVPLFDHAGVRLDSEVLPPLTRDWFEGKGDRSAALDRAYMRVALEVARTQAGLTGDNPAVGCVLKQKFGFSSIWAYAVTGTGGRPHAEEQALEIAGSDACQATAYLTLEPCAKRSTGAMSCADRLIEAGVARVVLAARDPHPYAAGVGIERLRAAGVDVVVGLLEEEARALNADFFAKWERG
jgi:pyrimidine deaminase RibD-like protein